MSSTDGLERGTQTKTGKARVFVFRAAVKPRVASSGIRPGVVGAGLRARPLAPQGKTPVQFPEISASLARRPE